MSGPIDIASPSRGRLSTSPRNQSSNLTSALQQANAAETTQPATAFLNPKATNNDLSRPQFGRQESTQFGTSATMSGARPISTTTKIRRDSTVGSFMGGMSWGGISIGSWVQDDIMMGGTSPYNFQSPSYHSSSYLPKMEANFWNNLKCCDTTFSDLHELLSHFEEVHSQAPSTFPYRMSISGSDRFARRKSSTSGDRATTQVRGFRPVSDSRLNGMHSPQVAGDGNKTGIGGVQDLDTLGEMDLDQPETQIFDQDLRSFDEDADHFSSPALSSRPPALEINRNSSFHSQQGQLSLESNPTTPRPAFQGFAQNNPMVSSVNTPTLTTQPEFGDDVGGYGQLDVTTGIDDVSGSQFSSNTVPFSSQMLQRLNNDFGNLDFGNNGNDMLDLCISEPAKALYSENGGFNTQQFPHFNFTQNTVVSNGDENARKLQAYRLASGMGKSAGEEERPFKCPVIGCEKSYKNANGLRYHEKHGHSTQKLKDNGDGSFSIVDPVTSIPYPGTMGMEKEKPYRCDVCGKRYKNLNGLKYHRNHSPPCNPDFSLTGMTSGGTGPGTPESGEA